MYKLKEIKFESLSRAHSLAAFNAEWDYDSDEYDTPIPSVFITVFTDDQQETATLPSPFQKIFTATASKDRFVAPKPEALGLLANKNLQAQRVILGFGEDEYVDVDDVKENLVPISHLWSAGTMQINVAEDDQICDLLQKLPNQFFTCAELRIGKESEYPIYLSFSMDCFTFLRAYCQKLVFEDGSRNPIEAGILEYLHKDLPLGLTPKWDSHTVCMKIYPQYYEHFVDGLKKRFLQAHQPINYKLILVMNTRNSYNVAPFVLSNSITKECLELKQSIHRASSTYECQQLFDDQNKNLVTEIAFDEKYEYSLLTQIERRIDS